MTEDKKFRDSGERREFQTGAVRDLGGGKGRLDLTHPFANLLVSRIYEVGCQKYGDRNWEKGIPVSRYLDSAMRHIDKYRAGLRDEPHLSMAAWNLSCAVATMAMVATGVRPLELFDLPSYTADTGTPLPLSSFELESLEKFLSGPAIAKSPERLVIGDTPLDPAVHCHQCGKFLGDEKQLAKEEAAGERKRYVIVVSVHEKLKPEEYCARCFERRRDKLAHLAGQAE